VLGLRCFCDVVHLNASRLRWFFRFTFKNASRRKQPGLDRLCPPDRRASERQFRFLKTSRINRTDGARAIGIGLVPGTHAADPLHAQPHRFTSGQRAPIAHASQYGSVPPAFSSLMLAAVRICIYTIRIPDDDRGDGFVACVLESASWLHRMGSEQFTEFEPHQRVTVLSQRDAGLTAGSFGNAVTHIHPQTKGFRWFFRPASTAHDPRARSRGKACATRGPRTKALSPPRCLCTRR
jgi:hypothetical protein